jgi:hypothetical protein
MPTLRELRQSILEAEIQDLDLLEKLKPSDPTGKYISDFVHSDNPKFAGKSKKERIRMALGAKYGAMRKMKEEAEQTNEGAMSDLDADRKDRAYQTRQAKTTMKHISNPTAGEKKAAKDIKPGIAGYRDRIAMLKSAKARGGLKD